MHYYTSRIILVIILSLFAGVLQQGIINHDKLGSGISEKTQIENIKSDYELAEVSRVIDGDTIELTNGKKVRYIGIDTPELNKNKKAPVECFAKEATKRNTNLVLGKTVKLVSDVNNTDKYGRLLRYVFLEKDDTFINKQLVFEGFAVAKSYPPDISMQNILRQAQRDARKAKRGLWADGVCK